MSSRWIPRIGPLYRREMRSYFNSPIAYMAALFFVIAAGVWFFQFYNFFARNQADLRPFFSLFPVLFTLLIPALTMGIWAEEKKMQTDELLLTLPFHEADLVLGKFLAALSLLALMLALTLPVPLLVSPMGSFDAGIIVAQYGGSLLLGAAGIALGLFISSLSRNQISAFLITLLVLLVLTLGPDLTAVVSRGGGLAALFQYLSLSRHFEGFAKGLLDTRDLLYYLLLTALFLYLNYKELIFRKWR